MTNIIKNTVLAGLGLISLTHEKAEEFAKELIRRGELSENETAKFVKDVLDQSEKTKTEIEQKLRKRLRPFFRK